MKLKDLIAQAAVCHDRFVGTTRMYENEGAIESLFQWTMNFPELQSVVEKASEKSIAAAGEIGVDAGPIASLFLKLKASVKVSGSMASSAKTVATDDNRLALLAVAEAWLGSHDQLTREPATRNPPSFFRFTDAFGAYAPVPAEEERLLADLGPEHGQVVLDRWRIDAGLHRNTSQFVYARTSPPTAAVLIVPENEDQRIKGSTNAAYDGYGRRIYFGKFGGIQRGVRFVDVMYYVADITQPQ